MVSVSDTGCGIPKEVRERIFEPFFTTKSNGEGTGMSLATVYGVVKNHGGSIQVYSEEGQGTTFKVCLPFPPDLAAQAADAEQRERVHGTGRILLVDDEEVVREVAVAILREEGYQVVTASNGKEAVERYRELAEEIDLVIIDMVMPEMDGGEVFAALKQINPSVKAILSTGYGRDGKAQDIIDEGMLGFVPKPYRPQDLSEAVATALSQ